MNNNYEICYQQGINYQDYIVKTLYTFGIIIIPLSSKQAQYTIGESLTGHEIKFDAKFEITDNLYIETHEKVNATNLSFIRSGILREDNILFYIIGNYSECYIFTKNTLKTIAQTCHKVETQTSQGFLLPRKKAEMFGQHIILKKN